MKKVNKESLNFKTNTAVNNNKVNQLQDIKNTNDIEITQLSVPLTPSDWAIDSILDVFGSEMISPGTAIDYFEENLIKSFDYTDVKEAIKFGENDEYVKVVLDNNNEYIFSADTKNMIAIKDGDEYVSLGEDGLEGLTSVIAFSELDSLTDVTIDDGKIAVSTEIGEVFYYNQETYELEGIKTSDYRFNDAGYFEGSGKYVSFEKVKDLYEEIYPHKLSRVWVFGDYIYVQINDYHGAYNVNIETGEVSGGDFHPSNPTLDEERLYYLKSINKYGKGEWNKPYCFFGM